MKYQVQIKYTNPAHEHVSLRRRVDTVTRLVEAANEQEALNRATRQQRSLGFIIKESEVVNSSGQMQGVVSSNEAPKKKKIVGTGQEETEIKKDKDGDMKEAAGGAESYPLLKPDQKLKPMKLKMGEEVDQIDEEKKVTHEDPLVTVHDKHGVRTHAHLSTANDIHGTKVTHTAVHAGDVKTKSRSDDDLTFKISKHHAKEVKEEVELDEAATDTYKRANYLANKLGKKDPKKSYTYRNLAIKAAARSNNPTGIQAGQAHGMGNKAMRKRGLEPVWRPDRIDEASDPDKRDAGYKMSPAVRKAQAASDALSKREKKPQAGTLAAAKMRKEEVDNKIVKGRKAAEKMINLAKSKANQINLTPTMDPYKQAAPLPPPKVGK